jgi:hypothetical protein
VTIVAGTRGRRRRKTYERVRQNGTGKQDPRPRDGIPDSHSNSSKVRLSAPGCPVAAAAHLSIIYGKKAQAMMADGKTL